MDLSTLATGSFIHFYCRSTRPAKDKFGLVVSVRQPQVLVLLVNSALSQFISAQPALLSQQILITCAEYGWLEYDSWLNCAEAHISYEPDLQDAKVVGQASAGLVSQVSAVAAASTTLNRRSKQWIHDDL